MTGPNEQMPFQAIQADREAAAEQLMFTFRPNQAERRMADAIRGGGLDHHAWVQAFARHRLSTAAAMPGRDAIAELICDNCFCGRTSSLNAADAIRELATPPGAAQATPTPVAVINPAATYIDAAAKHLRNTLQGGKRLTPPEDTPRAPKRKWIELARGTLRAARVALSTPETTESDR